MTRIIIACDGTGQSASREMKPTTNVIRFCHALTTTFSSETTTSPQILFYQSGLGTAAGGIIHDSIAEGTGLGIDDHLLDAYTFIMNNYNKGDEIYIFGYSRGAFTARVLAGLIVKLGIFRTKYLSDFKEAFKAYRTSEDEWKTYLKGFSEKLEKERRNKKQEMTQKAIIKVVGCWDTVGSVGVPGLQPIIGYFSGSSGVYDPSLVGSEKDFARIENAFHALALDEYRRPFSPTLWYVPSDSKTNVKQCWFPGVHSNVGGGEEDSALSDLTLAWMIDCCSPFLSFDQDQLDYISYLHWNPKDVPRPENNTRSKEEEKKNPRHDKDYKGWSKGWLYDSYWDSPMAVKAQGWRYRRPGEFGAKEGAAGLSVGTKEEIHASVRARWNATDLKCQWRPKSLSGFAPRSTKLGWEWFREGKSGGAEVKIEEAQIKKGGFEARLMNGPPK